MLLRPSLCPSSGRRARGIRPAACGRGRCCARWRSRGPPRCTSWKSDQIRQVKYFIYCLSFFRFVRIMQQFWKSNVWPDQMFGQKLFLLRLPCDEICCVFVIGLFVSQDETAFNFTAFDFALQNFLQNTKNGMIPSVPEIVTFNALCTNLIICFGLFCSILIFTLKN